MGDRRFEEPPPGVPHMPGTRGYFTCERGRVHSYRNASKETAVGYSVVLLARA